jgi:hypothetical protein
MDIPDDSRIMTEICTEAICNNSINEEIKSHESSAAHRRACALVTVFVSFREG